MAGSKRARELARAKYERQQAARAARRAAKRRNALIAGGVVVVVLIGGGVAIAATRSSSTSAAPSPSGSSSATSSVPPAPVPTPEGVSCTEVTAKTRTDTYPKASEQKLQPGATWTLDTNCGPITITLDTKAAPVTTNAIAFLTNKGFYTDAGCHRLTVENLFVVQCGSPSNNGQGGPGFKLPDENLPPSGTNDYPSGTVAMANAGAGTGGSQFFLVYKDTTLPPSYSIFGKITSGLDVVQYVASKGVAPNSPTGQSDGPPAQPLTIKTATIRNG